MRLIFLGDVVGEPGRLALYRAVPSFKEEYGADLIIVNGENAAGGRGITPRLCEEFFANGVDVITLGDHVWDQAELTAWNYVLEFPKVVLPHRSEKSVWPDNFYRKRNYT